MNEERRERIRRAVEEREARQAREKVIEKIASKVLEYLRSENVTIKELEKIMDILTVQVKRTPI